MVKRECQYRQDGVPERDPSRGRDGTSTELARLGRKVAEEDGVYEELEDDFGGVGCEVYDADSTGVVAQVFAVDGSDESSYAGWPESEAAAFAKEEEREYRKGIECKEWNGCWGYEAVLEALSGRCTLVVVFRGCVHWYGLSPTHGCVLH